MVSIHTLKKIQNYLPFPSPKTSTKPHTKLMFDFFICLSQRRQLTNQIALAHPTSHSERHYVFTEHLESKPE